MTILYGVSWKCISLYEEGLKVSFLSSVKLFLMRISKMDKCYAMSKSANFSIRKVKDFQHIQTFKLFKK